MRDTPQRRYKTILVDPPWANADLVSPRAEFTDWPYPVMKLAEIEKLPIPALADENCHLYIWAYNSFLPHACYLMQHWGFKYSNTLTWVKPSGVMTWWISRTQFLVFGFRGRLSMKQKGVPNVFGSPPTKHSQKPDISYEIIETVSFEPRLELFARRARPGWDIWGNEVASDLEIHI